MPIGILEKTGFTTTLLRVKSKLHKSFTLTFTLKSRRVFKATNFWVTMRVKIQ